MLRPWSFLTNPFLNATTRNHKMFLKMSEYHTSTLQASSADPFIMSLYTPYAVANEEFVSAYSSWSASEGFRKGSTAAVAGLMVELSATLIRKWDIAVQNLYMEGSAGYVTLLPNRRGPFQHGTAESRISEVGAFAVRLAGEPALATLKTEVEAFFATLNDARNKRDGKKTLTNVASKKVEHKRLAAGKLMFRNLGKCIDHFADNPNSIKTYFDLQTLRQAPQTNFTGAVGVDSMVNIVERTLEQDDVIKLKNNGDVPLIFYSSPYAGGKVLASTATITVLPGTVKKITAADMGDSKTNPYINVLNDHLLLAGHYKVSVR
jgi:hypothetical protein